MRCWGRGVKGYVLWGAGVGREEGFRGICGGGGRRGEGYGVGGRGVLEGARDMVLGEGGCWKGRGIWCWGKGGVGRGVEGYV